ncbi:hypothetical protein PVAND_015526 [Polypedilum vanderplanki]|uniref:Uncharacterized protein n=1 Tax=Polypedilum vanderplanki TaxID=319348 RepID=A0A9J6BDE0_POLVA|nr:hypothetical protein PVAND_015526 [Polypedilum vanderplanki]
MKILSIILSTFVFLIIFSPISISSFDLHCNFGTDSYYIAQFYHCKDAHIEIRKENEKNLKKVYGDHDDNFSNENVEAVWFDGFPIYNFPSGITEHFKDLQAIWISYAQFSQLKSEDLEEYKNLRLLHLNFGAIFNLKKDLFMHNLKLEYLDLSYNRIFFVESGAFNGLQKLTTFVFNKNVCHNDGVRDKASDVPILVRKIEENCKINDEIQLQCFNDV